MIRSYKKVANVYTKRAVDAVVEGDDDGKPVAAGRFADLLVFMLAYKAYMDHLEASGQEHDQYSKSGLSILKRNGGDIESGMNQFFGPLAERHDSGSIRMAIAMALRITNVNETGIERWDNVSRSVLPWIRSRQAVLGDIFTGRSARAVRELASAVDEENPASFINKLATIAPVSGITTPHRWIEAVASVVGAPISPTESVLVDAQVAKGLGEDLAMIDANIASSKPNTPETADLQSKRMDVIGQIGKVAEQSANPAAVLAVAANAKPTHQFATETGKKVGLTPEQEDAMMARGRVIIAAGAGSGKTRVLASKVAYHINEMGMPATAVLATSFTRKSSAELVRRCGEYGAVISGQALDGFGTTHAIAGAILHKRAPKYKRANYFGKKDAWKQTTVFRLAMDQVKMNGRGGTPPKPKGMWDHVINQDVPDQQQSAPAAVHAHRGAIDQAIGYYQWAARTWSGGPGQWAKEQVPMLQNMRSINPQELSDRQKQILNQLFAKVKGHSPIQYRVAADQSELPMPKQKQNKLDSYTYHKAPANQWFNLGRTLEIEDAKGNKKPIPMGEFRRAVSILKGKGLTPSQAWEGGGPFEAESDHAAVYAAYEWLKGYNGEPEFVGTGDMDDILIDTVSALVGDPELRRRIQSQYKVLLLDEAQDLNMIQHVLFGLMAGYMDPSTLEPKKDGTMTADTYSMIGDDSQAIYAFRGADPEQFIDKSDMVGGDFQTKLLDTNFRSGEAIVNAANQLILYNKKQIPKTCKANTDRNGQGRILSKRCADTEDAAQIVAEEISGIMESALPGTSRYSGFGVALRSNAEAYQYGVEMLKAGIPFKSNAQFFNDSNTKALIGWLTIADKGLNGDPGLMEGAVRDAVKAPFSNLGAAFFSAMDEKAQGSWANWLVSGGWQGVYSYGKWADILHHFVNNIEVVAQFTGTPASIVEQILQLRGADGSTMQEAMVASITENDDLMAELAAESEKGDVSIEQITEMAMAPIAPLIGLMKNKDNLGSAMTYVRRLKDVNSKLATGDSDKEIDRDAVTIGTMHSWKGLEVDTMYVPMVGSKFPRADKDGVANDSPELASERRLAYVAITRAEQRCVILDIPHPKFGTSSQFIKEACVQSDQPPDVESDDAVPPPIIASIEMNGLDAWDYANL